MLILPYIAFWAIVFANWEMMLTPFGEIGCKAP
jgi:hypothetical protein